MTIGDTNPTQTAGTGTVILNGGVLSENGVLNVNKGGALVIAGGKLSIPSLDVSNAGTFNFSGGTIQIIGGTITGPGGGFNYGGPNAPVLELSQNATLPMSAGVVQVGTAGLSAVLQVDGTVNTTVLGTEIDAGFGEIGNDQDEAGIPSHGTLTLATGGKFSTTTIDVGVAGGYGAVNIGAGRHGQCRWQWAHDRRGRGEKKWVRRTRLRFKQRNRVGR